MSKFLAKNWKVLVKAGVAVTGAVVAIVCGKSVIDETCYEERELGEIVTNEELDEEVEF